MNEQLRQEWTRFLASFFGSSNKLKWPSSTVELQSLMAQNEESLLRDPPGAVILPYVQHDDSTRYIALARDDDTAFELRRVLAATVGLTYAGPPRSIAPGEELDTPIRSAEMFAGSARRVTALPVVGGQVEKRGVRGQVTRTMKLLNERPARRFDEVRPFGRLLRDFDFALAVGNERNATDLLFKQILPEGRLSGLNRHFLQVRFLATFRRWDELGAYPNLDDLLRTARPALVSDSIARFALASFGERFDNDWGAWVAAFDEELIGRFGNLVTSVDAIRSEGGASYYVLWSLAAGDDAGTIQGRLAGLAWLESQTVQGILAVASTAPPEQPEIDEVSIRDACASGRYDRVIEMLASSEPSGALAPFVVLAVDATLSLDAARLLVRYREALGDGVFDETVEELRGSSPRISQLAEVSWSDWLQAEALGHIEPTLAVSAPAESSIAGLLSDREQYEKVVAVLRGSHDSDATGRALDAAITLLRRLEESAESVRSGDINRIRAAVIDLWAISDASGDRTRADEIVDQLRLLLESGCSLERYAELIDYFDSAWAPFRSDVAFDITVELLEVLAAARPDADESLVGFAHSVLGRLGPESVRRVDLVDVEIANSISMELDLGLQLHEWVASGEAELKQADPWQGRVGLYSLDAGALHRAKQALSSLMPEATVDISSDKVATASLRALAQRSDVMVVAWKAAKHSAGDAIKAERVGRSVDFAAGKGSSSLVREVLAAVERSVAEAA